MRVEFKKLTMEHFKSQEAFVVEFGPKTLISGRNGSGKSSTGESITWLLFGVDMMGSKFDPTPLTAKLEDITKVELLLEVENEGQEPFELLLAKQTKKGKAAYFVNEIPEKAGRFDEIVKELFDKDLFLSIFNPVYFPSQHWKEQRAQLLKYIEEPYKVEVFVTMSKQSQKAIEEPLKKLTIEQLVKKYSPIYKENKVKIERAGERVITLKEQLEAITGMNIDLTAVKEELDELQDKFAEMKATSNSRQEQADKKAELAYMLRDLKTKINNIAAEAKAKDQEPLQQHCQTCQQPLTEEAAEAVLDSRRQEIWSLTSQGKEMADKYRKIFKDWESLPDPQPGINLTNIQERIYELKRILEDNERVAELAVLVEAAEKHREQIRKEFLEAQEILEACKEYETKKAELMVTKVGSLFERLTVRLFTEHKNGNQEPSFEIEYNGKPYAKLSTAERIKAGLEMVEALIGQANKILPVFVDNAESIITFKKPRGQLITATVKNSHLVVKQEGQE